MKKTILTLCVIVLTAVSAFAGGGDETTKYLAPSYKQGWFVDVAGTYSWFAANGTAYRKLSPIYGKQFGFSGKIGKMITPSFGVRAGYDVHASTNRLYNGATSHFAMFSRKNDHFAYKSMHFDVMENPINLFFGYNPERIYNMYLYAGAAVMAADIPSHTRYIPHWSLSHFELGLLGGMMNNFRLSNALDFHVDFQITATRWSFDDIAKATYGSPRWHSMHFDLTAEAGFMWHLGGRTYTPVTEVVVPDCSEQEKTIAALNDEIARLRRLIEGNNGGNDGNNGNNGNYVGNDGQETDTVVKVLDGKTIVTYPFSVFFNKGSYELRDGRDRVNLQAIAKVAKDYNLKLNLRGTCDSGTGTPAFNKTLAENRCNKIKAELKKLGVDEKNITIEAGGGVKELTPAEYDRRVVITLSK